MSEPIRHHEHYSNGYCNLDRGYHQPQTPTFTLLYPPQQIPLSHNETSSERPTTRPGEPPCKKKKYLDSLNEKFAELNGRLTTLNEDLTYVGPSNSNLAFKGPVGSGGEFIDLDERFTKNKDKFVQLQRIHRDWISKTSRPKTLQCTIALIDYQQAYIKYLECALGQLLDSTEKAYGSYQCGNTEAIQNVVKKEEIDKCENRNEDLVTDKIKEEDQSFDSKRENVNHLHTPSSNVDVPLTRVYIY